MVCGSFGKFLCYYPSHSNGVVKADQNLYMMLWVPRFWLLQLLFCFDPPPWRGKQYIWCCEKRRLHPVASRSNNPSFFGYWILWETDREYICQKITICFPVFVFLNQWFSWCFPCSTLNILRYPHQWHTGHRQLSLRKGINWAGLGVWLRVGKIFGWNEKCALIFNF